MECWVIFQCCNNADDKPDENEAGSILCFSLNESDCSRLSPISRLHNTMELLGDASKIKQEFHKSLSIIISETRN